MDNLDTNTMILEQCRLDMENLAVMGSAGLSDAVAKAEKRARICGQELRQATKAVELTAKQKKTVEDARLAGEEKLAAATRDEEDARIAAETVKRMIDDAANVRGASNKDTAKILERAENVLDETFNRANLFHNEKKAQQKEIEHAMLRLYATEKAVLYTMAKAERNEGEKLLTKIIADKKHEVCAAEYEVLLLKATEEDLRNKSGERQDAIQHLAEEIQLAKENVENCQTNLEQAAQDFAAQLQTCAEENKAEMDALLDEQKEYRQLHTEAELELQKAEKRLSDCQQEEVDCRERLTQVQIQTRDAISNARDAYEQGLVEEDRQLTVYEEAVKHSQVSLEESKAKHESAIAEAERLRGLAEDFAARAADAEAEELSAKEAAATANRLAENAIKIRESISSESSQLLFHAQEVLLEAAASAQQLMDEKSLMRVAAQNESDRISKQAALSENTARQAGELVEIKKAACQEAELQLEQAGVAAEEKKEQLLSTMDRLVSEAEAQLRQAEEQAKQAITDVENAGNKRDAAEVNLKELVQELEDLSKRIERAQESGSNRQNDLQAHVDEETARLEEEHRLSQAKVAELQESHSQERDILAGLERDIANVLVQIETASAHVQEIIVAGVAAIQVAEEDVQRRSEEEQEAHRIAEDAVAEMSLADPQSIGMCNLNDLPEFSVEEPGPASLAAQIAEQLEQELPLDVEVEEESPALPQEEERIQILKMDEDSINEQESVMSSLDELLLAVEETSLLPGEAEVQAPEEAGTFEDASVFFEDIPESPVEEMPAEAPAPVEEAAEEENAPIEEEKPQTPKEEPPTTKVFSFVDSLLASESLSDEFQGAVRDSQLKKEEAAPVSVAEPAPVEKAEESSAETPAEEEKPLLADEETPLIPEEEKPLLPEEDMPETAVPAGESPVVAPAAKDEEDQHTLGGEVDEVAQAVMKAVSEAAARMAPVEDGDQPYEGNSSLIKNEPSPRKDWGETELSEEEKEYTSRLEDISARLLEHTIIPLDEEEDDQHLYQPSDWLTNLARSLGEDTPADQARQGGNQVDLGELLKDEPAPEGEVPDGRIKVPELELPPVANEGIHRRRQEEQKPAGVKKRRFPFF